MTRPRALVLADSLGDTGFILCSYEEQLEAAKILREQHKEIERLTDLVDRLALDLGFAQGDYKFKGK